MTSTHTREAVLRIRSFLTRVSSFQVATTTTWAHSTQNTVTAVSGHRSGAICGNSRAMYAYASMVTSVDKGAVRVI